MKFHCEQCHTKYSIADEKVRHKVLKIRCKHCNNIIIIRDQSRRVAPEGVAAEGAINQALGAGGRTVLSGMDGGAAHPSSPPAITETFDDEWYLAIDGHQYGPMSFAELSSRVRRGEARESNGEEGFVWRDGYDDWLQVGHVPELRSYAPPRPPTKPRSGLFPSVPPPMESESAAAPSAAPATAATSHIPYVDDNFDVFAARRGWRLWYALAPIGAVCGIVALAYVLWFDRPAPQTKIVRYVPVSDISVDDEEGPATSDDREVVEEEWVRDTKAAPRRSRRAGRKPTKASPAELSVEQKRLLALYKSGDREVTPQRDERIEHHAPRTVADEISNVEVTAQYRRHQQALQACYNRALKRDPNFTARKVEVKLMVSPEGRVDRVIVKSGQDQLDDCLKLNLSRWTFKAPGHPAEVQFAISLTGG